MAQGAALEEESDDNQPEQKAMHQLVELVKCDTRDLQQVQKVDEAQATC